MKFSLLQEKWSIQGTFDDDAANDVISGCNGLCKALGALNEVEAIIGSVLSFRSIILNAMRSVMATHLFNPSKPRRWFVYNPV